MPSRNPSREPFVMVPQWLAHIPEEHLSLRAKWLYVTIACYADAKRIAFPSRETLARDMGCSVSSVKRALKELVDIGAIRIQPAPHHSNFYELATSQGVFFAAKISFLHNPDRVTRDPLMGQP